MKKASFLILILILAMALSLSLVLAGCGEEETTTTTAGGGATTTTAAGETTTTAAGETTTTAGAGSDVLNFGGLFTLTGTAAVLGVPEMQGVELAIEDVNAAGGLEINGKKVKINFKYYDVTEDPAKVVDFTQRLIANDKVKVIAGARENTQIAGELKLTDPAKVIIYSAVASTPLLSVGSKYGLNITDNGAIEKHALIQLLSEPQEKLDSWGLDGAAIKQVKRVVLFGRNELYVQQGVVGAKEACEKLGFEWAGDVLFPPGTTDFLPYITKVKDLNPDAVILDTYSYDLMIPPLKDMLQIGGLDWTKGEIVLMGNDVLATQPFVDEALKSGISVNGALCFSASKSELSDRAKEIVAKIEAKYGPSPLATYVAINYDATMLVLRGIEASGTVDDGDQMLQGILGITYDGMNFPMKMLPQKQLDQPEFMLTVENDKVREIGAIYKDELYYGYALELAPALQEVIK